MTTQLHSSAVVISLTFFDIIVCASGCPRKKYFFRAFDLKKSKINDLSDALILTDGTSNAMKRTVLGQMLTQNNSNIHYCLRLRR